MVAFDKTIKVSSKTQKTMDDIKIIPRETYDGLINRIIIERAELATSTVTVLYG